MTLMGCGPADVRNFINQMELVRKKIQDDKSYRDNLKNRGKQYENVLKFITNFTSFLQYFDEINLKTFYRVRKSEGQDPYRTIADLKYPNPDVDHQDRMNNASFRVLYTSLHEFTAMAECRLDESFIGKYFQLTRFTREQPIRAYKLGLFSELYLNSSRDSEIVRNKTGELLGDGDHDATIRGYSALEIAMSNILYDKREHFHVLSSILADAIFSSRTEVDAIVYPSMQNRYGINVAFNKKNADSLSPSYSMINQLTEVHQNGFFQYHTKWECLDFSSPENLGFSELPPVNGMRR